MQFVFRNFPAMINTPGYWMDETSGVLTSSILAYMQPGAVMTSEQIGALRAYLRQWINGGDWMGEDIVRLRQSVEELRSRTDIQDWLALAEANYIDPL